jgi:hypothetical protein
MENPAAGIFHGADNAKKFVEGAGELLCGEYSPIYPDRSFIA